MFKNLKNFILLLTTLFLIALNFMFINIRKLNANEELVVNNNLIEKQTKISESILNNLDFTKPQIIVDPYDISPLTALVIFETTDLQTPTVIIKGKDNQENITYTFEENNYHYLPIYGLYPDYNNTVIVQLSDDELVFDIQTEALPKDFPAVNEIYLNDNFKHVLNDELYFLTPASVGYTCAYDKYGNVRWYLKENLVWEIKYLNNNNLILSNEKLINAPYYTTGLYELSLLGKIEKEFVLPGGYHHDVFQLENNNLIVASNDFDNQTVEDYIVEIDYESGEIIKEIDLKNILNTESGKSENWISYDWFHNNSVFYDKETNSLTLSGRHQDIIVNIDYDTLKINYIVGDPENHDDAYLKYFLTPINDLEWQYSQHAAKILPNGNLFTFDNGNNRAKNKSDYKDANDNYSRGVIYNIDQYNMEISQVFEYGKVRGSSYYSSYISDVDYLDDDHYLIHSGGIAYNKGEVLNNPPGLVEFDKLLSYTTEIYENEKIFELVINSNFYRAEKMKVYKNTKNHNFEQAVTLGKLNETLYDKRVISPFLFLSKDQELLESINLDIVKEDNRLVIKGEFSCDDEVSIVLFNKYEKQYYDVIISERPYTAMCIAIFDDAPTTITKYINDLESNKGEYSILLFLNGKYYNTNKKVVYSNK